MPNSPQWIDKWITWNDVNEELDVRIQEEKEHFHHKAVNVEVRWKGRDRELPHVQLNMSMSNTSAACTWKPHLCPEKDMVIGDLVFRSPALIFEDEKEVFSLIPDIDFIEKNRNVPHFMDYTEPDKELFYGLGNYKKTRHVYHKRAHQNFTVRNGQLLFRFYLLVGQTMNGKRDFRPVVQFLWEQFAKKRMITEKQEEISSAIKDLEQYAKYTYDWAFNRWEEIVWQEFENNGRKAGSNVFIVRAAQTPGRGEEDSWREKKSIWNQAWFSSLRSAYGYHFWGKYWGDHTMVDRAELAKNFALSAPQTNGLFPSVYTADKEHKWENGTWGHSDRRPEDHEDYGHLLDMSWTCFWMLKWYENIEKDAELLEYATNYADRLLITQSANGSFPGWIQQHTGKISPYLKESAETSMHVWFLARLYHITKEKQYLTAAEKGIEFVINEIIPHGRWEDFETYWSCSRIWEGKKYGEKDQRSGLYNQSNFSVYWTTEALLELYQMTRENSYLDMGEKVLAELSLHQSIWNPPYLKIPALGGFGVLTSDDEWNDARQSLFAKTYYKYYKITGRQEYKYRCIWAIKASFYMMYCPENPEVKKMYEDTFPYFGEKDYGFEMENSHHGDNGDDSQLNAGEFTIFDWGNGSASSTLAELLVK